MGKYFLGCILTLAGCSMTPPAPEPAPVRFNSNVRLSVFYYNKESVVWTLLGSTPAAESLSIPAGCEWTVTPKDGRVTQAVVEEVREQQIPALRPASAEDSDLALLKDLKDL